MNNQQMLSEDAKPEKIRLKDDGSYGTPTTRRFPRSMLEAFPRSPENYEWFFPPERNENLANAIVFWLGILGWILFFWFIGG